MMTAYYAKVLFDFETFEVGELNLKLSDVVKVLNAVDDNWLYGSLNGKVGNFPKAFVHPLKLPNVSNNQSLAVAIRTFTAEMPEDLGFSKGDIIVTTEHVDDMWRRGECNGKSGIYPVTHVATLDPIATPEVSQNSTNSSKTTGSNTIATARALMDLRAQLSDELSFNCGDFVSVTEVIDESFAVGFCVPGKSGMFPLSFVEIIEGDVTIEKPQTAPTANFNWWKDSSKSESDKSTPNTVSVSSKPPLPPTKREIAPPMTSPGDISALPVFVNTFSYGTSDTNVTAYGQSLFPFVAENENELTFFDNEIITLIRHINSEWTEGEVAGKRGIFPTDYVKIIVDCETAPIDDVISPVPEASTLSDHQQPVAGEPVASQHTYGLVKYDLGAERDGDLDVNQGDTVTILSQLDQSWFLARHDDGRTGAVPVSYVELFSDVEFKEANSSSGVAGDTAAVKAVATAPHTPKPFPTADGQKQPPLKSKPQLKPKPALKPKPVELNRKYRATSLDLALNDLVRSEMHDAKRELSHNNNKETLDELKAAKTHEEASRNKPNRPRQPPVRQMSQPIADMDATVDVVTVRQDQLIVTGSDEPPPRPTQQPPRYENLGPKPVPRRAAPPTPGRPKTDSSQGGGAHNGGNESEAITILRNRIRETEQDLENCQNQERDIQQLANSCSDEIIKAELHDNMQFCRDNINGLRSELADLTARLQGILQQEGGADAADIHMQEQRHRVEEQRRAAADAQQEEQRARRREQRTLVVAEIVQTERDFLNCMVLCYELFMAVSSECQQLDMNILFGKMPEVIEVSQQLLKDLEEAEAGERLIGRCFLDIQHQIIAAFGPYCKNYDDAVLHLEKLEGSEEVQSFLATQVETMRRDFAVFDLGSVLIKPVQRVLKYPLLLNELAKNSDKDVEVIMAAISAMTDVASKINEFKRRKDLVLKYKNHNVSISDKVSRLNIHSTRKKFHRITQRIVGVQTVDEKFDREERRFHSLEKVTRQMVKNLTSYMDNLRDTVTHQEIVANDFALFYGDRAEKEEVEEFCNVHSAIATEVFPELRADIEGHILGPLNRLLTFFPGPAKVIKKRHDKLLDFENFSSKVRSDPTVEPALQAARADYDALNAQLLDELPKLCDLGVEVLRDALLRLLFTQKRFQSEALGRIYQLFSLPLLLPDPTESDRMEAFNASHSAAVDRLCVLSFTPKSFSPKVEESRRRSRPLRSDTAKQSSQSPSRQAQLRRNFPADRLFTVTSRVVASGQMDLSVHAGTLVGVLKEGDPMGNKDRWFVDNGVSKGFLSRQCLTLAEEGASPISTAAQQLSNQNASLLDLDDSPTFLPLLTPTPASPQLVPSATSHSVTQETSQTNSSPQNSSQSNQPVTVETRTQKQWRVLYSFTARSDLELSVNAGDVIQVLQTEDDDGNAEWYKAAKDGCKGYVPANYLSPLM